MKRQSTTNSWEPSFWKTCCCLSICPTYKRFANYISILLIGILLWSISYGIIPDLVRPGGKLFDLAFLTVSAYIGGKLLLKLTTLPALIGMLLVGILYQNLGWINFDGGFSRVNSELRRMALVIILTRAGLSLDRPTMRKMFLGVLKLGLIPWIAECIAVGLLGHYVLNLPWDWAFLLSCIIASVSPAVVVPCFIRFQSKGYGVDKGIPTLILAAATIDDTTSIAVYGIISSIMFTESSLMNTILQGPISIISGIAIGVLWGYVITYFPERSDSFLVPLRSVLLFLGGYISVLGSNIIGYGGAGPLAVISAAFICGYNWSEQGWSVKNNPVSSTFRISWIMFEPILFGLTGAQVKLTDLDSHFVGIGIGCLLLGVIFRMIVTVIICFGGNFNMKEKIFIGLSWMAKATVQAALGPLALESIIKIGGSDEEIKYGKILLNVCILSIVLTAPLGAVIIALTGPKLLTKLQIPPEEYIDESKKDVENTEDN